MPKVAFLIPASPTDAFLSQIAAFTVALRQLAWKKWEPSVLVCMGGHLDGAVLDRWSPYLSSVAITFAPRSEWETTAFFYAQIDGLFRRAPQDADVLVRMDADTLPVRDFEDVLDYVHETSSIAGVIAHFPFPNWPEMTSREVWQRVGDGLVSSPIDLKYAYSLWGSEVPEEYRTAPFYVNDGAVFFPKPLFAEFARRYLSLRPQLMERLPAPYFSGQIALSLAVSEMRATTCALPMRYNFPNDEMAVQRFPEELEHVVIFHYLRTDGFDRQRIFLDENSYHSFLDAPLLGANKAFQQHVRSIIGASFPFGRLPEARTVPASSETTSLS
jgi:hypothetical protein